MYLVQLMDHNFIISKETDMAPSLFGFIHIKTFAVVTVRMPLRTLPLLNIGHQNSRWKVKRNMDGCMGQI